MNPRDFFREPGYPIALLTTYSFDPHFFEQLVLPDLWAGGSNSVLVLVDQNELRSALYSHLGQLQHIGRRYFLQPVESPGAFHPKVFLRLGDRGGLVWVGSNNLTRGGWGANSELGSAWRLDPSVLDGCGWLRDLLTYLDSRTSGLAKDLFDKARHLRWLGGTPTGTNLDVLISHSEPIGMQARDRWAHRRFTNLKILTGSTDRDAGFLRWATHTFGLENIDICLTPECASFEPAALHSLDPVVRIVLPPQQKLMHAKFYWFDGPDGPGVLWGSANCSRSAWLVNGRNVEAMVVEDAPDPGEYAEILQVFEQEGVDPSDVLTARATGSEHGDQATPSLRIVGASADSTGRVQVEVEPAIPSGADVFLEARGVRLPMKGEGNRWTGGLSTPGEASGSTLVRVVADISGSAKLWSDVRWIDRLAELRDVLTGINFRKTIVAMRRFESRAADQQLAQELGRIGMMLLSDSSSYPDVTIFTRHASVSKKQRPQDRPPLDPETLLVSLGDSDHDPLARPPGTLENYGISGVFRVLFAQVNDDATRASVVDAWEEEPAHGRPRRSHLKASKESTIDVDEQARRLLRNHMEQFLRKYEAPEFATSCTATQLAQATAYPIVVAAMGGQRGWCTEADRGGWVTRAMCVLLTTDRLRQRNSLLSIVSTRYADEDELEAFECVVGDGQLWLTLRVAWDMLPENTAAARLQKIALLRDLISRRDLLESADESRLVALYSSYVEDDAIKTIRSLAIRLGRTLNDLECWLRQFYEQVKDAEASMKLEYQAHELVWNPKCGWGITKEDQQGKNVQVYVAEGNDVRNFRVRGWRWLVNVSQLGATVGCPAKFVSKIETLLRFLQCSIGT